MSDPKLNEARFDLRSLPRPGLRNIKTAIAVFLCFAFYTMIGRDSVMFAAIAALLCMQNDVSKSIRDGLERVFGTCLGGAASVLVMMFEHLHMNKAFFHLACAVGVSLLIYLGVLFNKKESIVISCVVFIMLVTGPFEGDPVYLALSKIIDTIIGIVISIIVNKVLFEPGVPEKGAEPDFDHKDLDDLMKRE